MQERSDFNKLLRPGKDIGLPDYEIAHLWGPGFGDEAFDGMMYAPREVNQVLQNLGIELRLRELQALYRREGIIIELTARAESHPLQTLPGHKILKKVSYSFEQRLPNGKRNLIGEVDITIPPPGPSARNMGRYVKEVQPGSAWPWSNY
jgi:Bacterial toxin 4